VKAEVEILPGVLDVPGVHVGVVTDAAHATGVTAVVLPPGATGAAAVTGGAPATRETDLLRPENLVPGPDAILLLGGSAYGLRAADGAMEALRGAGRGLSVAGATVPIVVAAAIFDLAYGAAWAPTADDGRAAVEAALAGLSGRVPEGSVGAGAGATVGKLLGLAYAMKGGQGAVTVRAPDGLAVGAVAVVNALGSVIGRDGEILAGPRPPGEAPMDSVALLAAGRAEDLRPGEATTVAAVVVGARLGKAELLRVATMAHDGLARAIRPAHTLWDGDTVFAAAVGERAADPTRVGTLAALALEEAIRRAVTEARQ
jgi:L-aminopeptidase/D-esterase-like protein